MTARFQRVNDKPVSCRKCRVNERRDMPATFDNRSRSLAILGQSSALCTARSILGSLGIGTSSGSGEASPISEATTRHSSRRLGVSLNSVRVKRSSAALINEDTRSTQTCCGRPFDEVGGARTTHPRPRPLRRDACRTPGGTHATRCAGMIHAPSSVSRCEIPVSTRIN